MYIYILSSLYLHHLEDNVTPFISDKKIFNATEMLLSYSSLQSVQSQGLVARPTFTDSEFSNDKCLPYSLDMIDS